ncbi:hypothetical protein CC1G_12635 [Coprinopsis cinerea okayama7|uniref:DUF6533 domain-containing protein n=1 Tax=Coprinopsis cinerea (strain Okayama-7 / 130 / ATCC MYA-4618 / FGSC 9003) TaxID=240176 RepID=A8N734_COPC7|nr:hypothetical protein CC1G_12635 [Coprinopsis cinerea okayama7\|eukprot:XP_001830640.2 hypothetical protein CC1G_12635 [Coprinopsis cinerea okayama7\
MTLTDDDGAAEFKLIAAGLVAKQALSYVHVACVVLWLTDYLDLLHLEIQYIWFRKTTLVKLLYIFMRYLPFVILPLFVVHSTLLDIPVEFCKPFFTVLACCVPACYYAAQGFLFLRVHALGYSRILTKYLVAHYVSSSLIMGGIFVKFLTTLHTVESSPFDLFGCTSIVGDGRWMSINYAIILFNEVVMMVLTICIAYRKYILLKTRPLVRIFYRDGTFYFVILAAISTGNILANWLPPDANYAYLLTIIQFTLHNALTTRMMLHVRQVAAEDSDWGPEGVGHGGGGYTEEMSAARFPIQFRGRGVDTYLSATS